MGRTGTLLSMPPGQKIEEIAMEEERGRIWDTRLSRAIMIVVALLVVLSFLFVGYYVYAQRKMAKQTVGELMIEEAEKFVRQNPRNADARVRLGALYVKEGRYDDGIDQFNQALKVTYDHEGALLYKGLAYMNKKDYGSALASFGKEIKYYKNTAAAGENAFLEQAYYYSAVILWKKKDYDQAIDYVKKALAIRKTSSDSYLALGRIYYDKGSYDEAINNLNEALKYDPKFAEVHYLLGAVYEKKGEKDKAIEAYKKTLEIQADFPMAKDALKRLKGGG
jgi:tetratricopeptide (TPR) repeat protein